MSGIEFLLDTNMVIGLLKGHAAAVALAEQRLALGSHHTGGQTMNAPNPKDSYLLITDQPFATDGAETPFGPRWGGERITLTPDHLAALQAGKTIALDVMGEYVTFLRLDRTAGCRDSGQAGGAGV